MMVMYGWVFGRLAPIGLLALGVAACAPEPSPSTRLVIEPTAAYDAQIAHFASLYEENRQDLQVLIQLSRALRHGGRGDDAVEVLRRSENSFSSDAEYLAELGKAHLAAGQFGPARIALSDAVARDPRDWQALSALGVANDLEHRPFQARDAYGRALILCPNSAAILNNLALSESYRGDLEASLRLLTRALEFQPMSLRIHQNMLTLREFQSRCATCSDAEYARLARTIYPHDWINTTGDLSCGNNVVRANRIAAELKRNDFIDMRVHFEFDSAELTAETQEALDELGAALKTAELRDYQFRLEGHADAVGADVYNLGLSERRAASVTAYLVERHGIEMNRLESVGFGERQLANPNDPTSGINRRVRVIKVAPVDRPLAGL